MEKRRDTKGRLLRNGEMQRPDGRYMYRYVDKNGVRRTVYSWKLVDTDAVPNGKRCKEALRLMEQRIQRDLEDNIRTNDADQTTVNMLFDQFMETRTDLRPTTRINYQCLYDKHLRNTLGKKKIGSVRYSDVFKYYLDLHQSETLCLSSIQKLNAILMQMFETAAKDNTIRKNPAESAMRDILHKIDEEPKKRQALTTEQQANLLDHIYSTCKFRRYAPLFTTLLGTGMRIGEALGLTWNDVDFEKSQIFVTHSLSYKPTIGSGYAYHVTSPKTKAGVRMIPMFSQVRDALISERENNLHCSEHGFTVDGYSGFIFLNGAGKVYTPTFIFDVIQNIVSDYNLDERLRAMQEHREPNYLPKISAHIFRHTFCTRLCENESNLKIIQDVMGHKRISTTMNVYNEATEQAKSASFAGLEGKIKLA